MSPDAAFPGPPVSRSELHRELDHLRSEIQLLRELIERTLAERERALDLQRAEYHRRLDELNNAHDRALEAQQATVPRELFTTFVAGYQAWREEVTVALAHAKGAADANTRTFSIVVILVGLAFTLISIGLRFFAR